MIKEEQSALLEKGEMLPVMEHFYTLQGEGAHAGKAAYFIRIGGCDVGCHWCDVKESWNAALHPLMSATEIAETAASHCNTIVLTGGEPSMYNLTVLTKRLKELGCTVHIETSGAYPLVGEIDWITLSPKKTALPQEDIYKRANELKVIIFNNHDFIFAEQEAAKVSLQCELYLQSEWSKRAEMYPKMIEYAMAHPRWRVSVQTHKYLNIP